MTKTFKIFQIHLTNSQVDEVNNAPRDKTPAFYRMYLDATFGRVKAAWEDGMYQCVATIQAENLEDVFRVGNIGPEEQITRLGRRMSSVSVGNIIEDDAGKLSYVASFGFNDLDEEDMYFENNY